MSTATIQKRAVEYANALDCTYGTGEQFLAVCEELDAEECDMWQEVALELLRWIRSDALGAPWDMCDEEWTPNPYSDALAADNGVIV